MSVGNLLHLLHFLHEYGKRFSSVSCYARSERFIEIRSFCTGPILQNQVPAGASPKTKFSIIGVWGKLPNKQNEKFRLRAEFLVFAQSCTGSHCLRRLYQIKNCGAMCGKAQSSCRIPSRFVTVFAIASCKMVACRLPSKGVNEMFTPYI